MMSVSKGKSVELCQMAHRARKEAQPEAALHGVQHYASPAGLRAKLRICRTLTTRLELQFCNSKQGLHKATARTLRRDPDLSILEQSKVESVIDQRIGTFFRRYSK